MQVRVGGRWRSCPPTGGNIYLSPLNDDVSGHIECPLPEELCNFQNELWPTLRGIEPANGPTAGGILVTLRGERFDALRPPVRTTYLDRPRLHAELSPQVDAEYLPIAC